MVGSLSVSGSGVPFGGDSLVCYFLEAPGEQQAPLPGSANQLAATFGTLGQVGAIPVTTKSLNERDGVYHAAAENIYRSEFVGESRTLSGCYLEVAGDAALVAHDGEFQIFLSCRDGFVLNLSFVFEDPQCSHVVLDLLEARKHGLAIVSDGLIVRSDGLVRGSPTSSDVENGEKRGRASRPQNTGAGEQCCD